MSLTTPFPYTPHAKFFLKVLSLIYAPPHGILVSALGLLREVLVIISRPIPLAPPKLNVFWIVFPLMRIGFYSFDSMVITPLITVLLVKVFPVIAISPSISTKFSSEIS